ncbi:MULTISPECIES: ArsR/SmtB family transcription factor [Actinoalloteichus]|uniref:ArsR/SmtB family transcription factor n=1 Tax=Actinoalloteichus TaxID=65496 RepID=UPI000951766B|nr:MULTISPECIES: metalloregulator ArsR/SmtB family transcription factor [Actinoalloteichus]
MDEVFKALADPSRRRLLDSLNERGGLSLSALCVGLTMTRQSVSRHLEVLAAAGLVTTLWRGREKLHYLNAAPINAVTRRWISQYDHGRLQALADLTTALERPPMGATEFVYTIYVQTTPERLWQALTEPEFTRRYWGVAYESDWRVGSPVKVQIVPGEEFRDLGAVVLESEPHHRLSYTDGTPPPEHLDQLGWDERQRADALKEPQTRTTFLIEAAGPTVRLTLIHDGFESGSEKLAVYAESWPELLSSLKTLLETGEVLPASSD